MMGIIKVSWRRIDSVCRLLFIILLVVASLHRQSCIRAE